LETVRQLKPGAQIALVLTVATGVLWAALSVLAPPDNPWINFLLGAVFFLPCLVAFLTQLTPVVVRDARYIQPGQAAIVRDRRGNTRLVEGSEVQRRVMFSPADGETVEMMDCRERSAELPHVCQSADGATVAITVCVLWSIASLPKYLARAQSPADIVDTTVRATLTRHLGEMESSKIIASAYTAIEDVVMKGLISRMPDYGVAARRVDLTQLHTWPRPKSDEKDKKGGK
jgi:hypothetical protein